MAKVISKFLITCVMDGFSMAILGPWYLIISGLTPTLKTILSGSGPLVVNRLVSDVPKSLLPKQKSASVGF